jgi:hypothetical protein
MLSTYERQTKQGLALGRCLLLILAISAFFFQSETHVQAQPLSPEQQRDRDQHRDDLLYYIGDPSDVTGRNGQPLPLCSTGQSADDINITTLYRYCAGIETADGFIHGYEGAERARYRAGERVRCSITGLQNNVYTCSIQTLDGSGRVTATRLFDGYGWNGDGGLIETDAEGNVTGEQTGNGPIGSALLGLGEQFLQAIAWLILQFSTWLLGIAGTLFNWLILKTVFQFSQLIGNSPGLLIAWGILRDMGNLVLLFGFIFIGLATILDLHTYTARKTLPKLIIFAVLMNFSLFTAEAVIDTSNALSATIANQASTNNCASEGTATAGSGEVSQAECAVRYGIAGHIIQSAGLQSG